MKLDRYDESWKNLWRNSQKASPEDKWKWDHYIWEPILEKIWVGDTDQLTCPVCDHENVYFKHLAFRKIRSQNEERILADLWVGCERCNTQIRETVLVPDWLKETVEWTSEVKE